MDEGRMYSSLMALRREWETNQRSPFFDDRREWVRGILKGIDLSIARLNYAAPPAPKTGGIWLYFVIASAVVAGAIYWAHLSVR